ncbi:MAG TPA: hypothetical protein VHX65_02165 [Pirellulales bacterium]|jgi:hypothetical protein|nr:hypothetical protein [Pirellulales bacterium]
MDPHQPDAPRNNGIEQFRPVRPERPDEPPTATKRKSSLSIILAAGALLFGIAILAVLMGPVSPVVFGAIGMVLLLAALAAFHYVVWGWWLGNVIRSEVEAEERAEEEAQRRIEKYSPRQEKPESHK